MAAEELCNLENSTNQRELISESLKSTVTNALVEKFISGDERPCNTSDFLETKLSRENVTSEISLMVENFFNTYSDVDNELLALLLILCGQNLKLQPWNTKKTVENCQGILRQLMKFLKCEDISEFISKNTKVNLIKTLFQILCLNLTSTTWKHFPASVVCYEWILGMIKQPNLSQHLQFVLPPALLLSDDFVNENKITGAKCLDHIINNITVAELQLCGHGNVIYSALLPQLRIREADIINSAVPPLLSVTSKLEFDLGKKDITKWSKFDDILEIFLENMELEQLIALRNCYISNLMHIFNVPGVEIMRWSKRLLRIFHEYVQTARKCNDEKTINDCVKVIEKYIQLSPQEFSLYSKNLLVTLVCALHFTNKSKTETQNESKEVGIKCIRVLLTSLSESERKHLEDIFQKKFPDINFVT